MSDAAAPSGRQFPITAGAHRAVVVEVGGGIREYGLRGDSGAQPGGSVGRPVLAGYAASAMTPHSAGAVLAPWPNRVRDGHYVFGGVEYQLPLTEPALHNAIHGLARWVRWTPVDVAVDSVELAYDLPAQTGYPFPLRIGVRWSVGPDGLRADHTVTNVGTAAVPFGLGTHPYLHLGGARTTETRLTIPAATWLESDERNCPIGSSPVSGTPYDLRAGAILGELPLNTPFTDLDRDAGGIATVVLQTPDGTRTEVWMDGAFGYVQAYCAPGFGPGEHAIAVEPMSCAPDAFNSGDGLVTLQPGAHWTGSWGIRPS